MRTPKYVQIRFSWKFWFFLILVPCVYCISILVTVYANVWSSGLAGGGNGPADAYRHSLASALVAHTLSSGVVDSITYRMEVKGGMDNTNKMDAHNNQIGAMIGSNTPLSLTSFGYVIHTVREAVDKGEINTTNPNQITWLPEKHWNNARWH